LFRKTPLKAQNDYIFLKFLEAIASLAPLATPMLRFPVSTFNAYEYFFAFSEKVFA